MLKIGEVDVEEHNDDKEVGEKEMERTREEDRGFSMLEIRPQFKFRWYNHIPRKIAQLGLKLYHKNLSQ